MGLQPERLQCLQILVILAASSAEFKVDTIEDDDDRPSSVSSAARPSGPTFCALITPMRLMMATDSNGVGGGSRLLSMYSWRCESLSESVISTMAMSSSASLSPPLCFLGKFGKFAAILILECRPEYEWAFGVLSLVTDRIFTLSRKNGETCDAQLVTPQVLADSYFLLTFDLCQNNTESNLNFDSPCQGWLLLLLSFDNFDSLWGGKVPRSQKLQNFLSKYDCHN